MDELSRSDLERRLRRLRTRVEELEREAVSGPRDAVSLGHFAGGLVGR